MQCHLIISGDVEYLNLREPIGNILRNKQFLAHVGPLLAPILEQKSDGVLAETKGLGWNWRQLLFQGCQQKSQTGAQNWKNCCVSFVGCLQRPKITSVHHGTTHMRTDKNVYGFVPLSVAYRKPTSWSKIPQLLWPFHRVTHKRPV